jgi:hypothetical protein
MMKESLLIVATVCLVLVAGCGSREGIDSVAGLEQPGLGSAPPTQTAVALVRPPDHTLVRRLDVPWYQQIPPANVVYVEAKMQEGNPLFRIPRMVLNGQCYAPPEWIALAGTVREEGHLIFLGTVVGPDGKTRLLGLRHTGNCHWDETGIDRSFSPVVFTVGHDGKITRTYDDPSFAATPISLSGIEPLQIRQTGNVTSNGLYELVWQSGTKHGILVVQYKSDGPVTPEKWDTVITIEARPIGE